MKKESSHEKHSSEIPKILRTSRIVNGISTTSIRISLFKKKKMFVKRKGSQSTIGKHTDKRLDTETSGV